MIDHTETLFKIILEEYNDAIIAGGAIRDKLLGHKPKDIDIFVMGHSPYFGVKLKGAVPGAKVSRMTYANGAYGCPHIMHMYNIERVCPVPVQLIELKMGSDYRCASEYVVKHFDWNINKCWYTIRTKQLSVSHQCQHDMKNKKLTFNVSLSTNSTFVIGQSFKDRLPRLRKKFPDHEVVVL